MKCRYSKNSVEKNWVTFYQNSNFISFSFSVRFNLKGEVDCVMGMDKRESKEGEFYVADFNGNITEREFNEALLKTLEFLTKRNYSIMVTTNLREPI